MPASLAEVGPLLDAPDRAWLARAARRSDDVSLSGLACRPSVAGRELLPALERSELHLQQCPLVPVGGAPDPVMWLAAHQRQQRDNLVRARRHVRRMRRDALADLKSMVGHSAVGYSLPEKARLYGVN